MGYMNLGHCYFFGISGYVFAILAARGFSLSVAVVCGVLASLVFAVLVAVPFFRLRGAYFALGNLGLIMLLEMMVTNLKPITGGDDGLTVMVSWSSHVIYFMSLVLAVGTILLNYFIGKSRFGLAMISIREDEDVAKSFGIRTFRVKLIAFVLGALPAALVGQVYAVGLTFINPPAMFGADVALMPVTMALFGGTGLTIGPIIGTTTIYTVQEILWTRLPYLNLAIYGAVLILTGLFMPGGLARLHWLRDLWERLGLSGRIYRSSGIVHE